MKNIIVIGGGVLGAATAYQLAGKGASVVLIDRNDQGQATDAAAGIVCPWLSQRRNKAWYRLAKGGAAIYPDLIEALANDGETETGYNRVGAISIHTDEKKLIAMKERAIKRRDQAPEIGEVTLLNTTQTKEMFPPLADGYGSVHVSGAARVDGRALRHALVQGAKKRGATIIHGDAKLIYHGNQITGAVVHDSLIEADTVIATSGAWMDELLQPLGVSFNVVPQRAQIMHLQVTDYNTAKWPVIMPPNDQYMLSFQDQRIVIGATHENEAGFDHRVTAGGINEILTKALQVAPGLASSTVLETRVGFRPFTPNFLPVLGPLPGFDGLLIANGLGASGLTMGPYIGSQLTKIALGEEPDIDITDYDVANALK
ncbi:D-amino-acid dehydrogenase [Virgibacillus halotolerans]|uniref:NAD(P)/FAD-dependent oxidoreductase n=1 Tax=Virgibacillus halotolerans TaxID=1071053 RepID=UPI001961F463|nr:FAD-dependent oxidoreductase [Virgibacillus halotolerans]MBM7600402.1 D-amino-acid dehydrogenase [Virgibacillus halotolerans]